MDGITDMMLILIYRNVSKSSVATAQLTIFYAGSVCVYDHICPEKVQFLYAS